MKCFLNHLIVAAMSLNFAACGPQGSPFSADETDSSSLEFFNGRRAENSPAFAGPCPRFPVVFHHGFMGSKSMGSFVGVEEHFKKSGCKILVTEVASTNTSEYRGVQLKTQIDAYLSATGAEKVHIIAHSQGGLDARYAISVLGLGSHVASLSTLSTPHQGTMLADFALEKTGPLAQKALFGIMNFMGKRMGDSTPDADTLAAVKSMSVKYMKETFNPMVPDIEGVIYQSWGAKSGFRSGDQLKATMVISHGILAQNVGDNDGVVPVASSSWGVNRGVLIADHLDLIGMRMLDLRSPFKHLVLINTIVGEFAAKGL